MKEMDEELHIEMHRLVDELGKFSIHMTIRPDKVMSRERCEQFSVELLKEITKECMHDGADLVGHVKSFLLSEHGTSVGVSLVHLDIPVNVNNSIDSRGLKVGDLTVHVIVHGIWDPDVKHASMETIERLLPEYGIKYDIIQDYYETEKGIAHHQK
ncbi:MAG: hypothetical protein A4E32_01645 [Methanomassiliicoccales archaeon PtaU1.Bin124]|nr:MAG: hypothetical protein A4E32_01645 [Methanomassiliicoccales archaeon PtaU1.Bin124]